MTAATRTYGDSLTDVARESWSRLRATGPLALAIALVGWCAMELCWGPLASWASWIHPRPPVGYLVVSLALAIRATVTLLVFIVLLDPHGRSWPTWHDRIRVVRTAAPMFVLFLSAWGMTYGNELVRFLDRITVTSPVPERLRDLLAITVAALVATHVLGAIANRARRASWLFEVLSLLALGAFAYLVTWSGIRMGEAIPKWLATLPALDLHLVSLRAVGSTQQDAAGLWSFGGLIPNGWFANFTDTETWRSRPGGSRWQKHLLTVPMLAVATAALVLRATEAKPDASSRTPARSRLRATGSDIRTLIRPGEPGSRSVAARSLGAAAGRRAAGSRRRLDSVGIAIGTLAICGIGGALLLAGVSVSMELLDVYATRMLDPRLPAEQTAATAWEMVVSAAVWSMGLVVTSAIAIGVFQRGMDLFGNATTAMRSMRR